MWRFRRLCEQHKDRIYTYARYYLGNREDAEDATQEVLLRLWRHGRGLPAEDLPRWLTRVARNLCFDVLRRRRKQAPMDDRALAKRPATGPDPERDLQSAQFRRRLEEALGRLDETQRSIVILRHIQGYSYSEIAAALDMPLNTVKVYLHRARRHLRHLLQEDQTP